MRFEPTILGAIESGVTTDYTTRPTMHSLHYDTIKYKNKFNGLVDLFARKIKLILNK